MNLKAPALPTPELAMATQRFLQAIPHPEESGPRIRGLSEETEGVTVTIPRGLYDKVVELMSHVASGRAVTVVPIHAELTTQEAAEFLNVSRPYVIKLIETSQIPHVMVGTHRRIRFEALVAFKQEQRRRSLEALDALTKEAQEDGFY